MSFISPEMPTQPWESEPSTLMVEGQISREPRSMGYLTYKVHNFFSMPEEVDHFFTSPTFSFLDGTWYLKLYPFGEVKYGTKGWIALYFVKQKSVASAHHIKLTMGMKKEDGTVYESYDTEHNFERDDYGWGFTRLVQRSSLLRDKRQVAPEGTVTFFCSFQARGADCKNVDTQAIYVERKEVITDVLERLQKNLESLIDAEDGDVVLKLKDRDFKAHKNILRVRSTVFQSLFSQEKGKNETVTVEVSDCDPEALRELLLFLYCGKVKEFSKNRAFDMFWLADKYDVPEIRAKSLEFISNNIEMETIYDVLKFSARSKESTIVELVTKFFKKHVMEIISTEKWMAFLKQYPEEANELYIKAFRDKSPNKHTL